MKTLNDYLNYQQNLHPKEIDLGLTRIKKVYLKLFPQGVNFKVITIAGTNGKGSTAAFLASIFYDAGISYGVFSSPHIDKYNERININNTLASDKDIIDAFNLIDRNRGDISLSYFEFSTLAAIILFAKKKVDIAIMEVGLGGRLDSTNILDADIAIITTIAFDHTNFLGNTLDKIAYEKSGIMRRDKAIITSKEIHPEVIKQAKIKKAKLYLVDKIKLNLQLPGEHQKFNASMAKEAALLIDNTLTTELIDNSLVKTFISGRFEKIRYKKHNYILDTAHNPQAVERLAKLIPDNSIAIFAVMADKDYLTMINLIKHKIKFWYLLELDEDRALKAKEIENLGIKSKIFNSPEQIINNIYQQQGDIIVFGSFLTISAIRSIIKV